jgi:chromosome partitioning protein
MEQTFKPTLICVASQKGGVGKTTSAISIAHKLALLGHETMLMDLDAQGHCAISLGMNPEPCVFDWLSVHYGDCAAAQNALRATGRAHLSLIPGDSRTRHVEQLIALGRVDVRDKLELLIIGMPTPPAYIVVDTSAGGVLQETAMRLAQQVIIPVRLESLGMDGVAATLGILTQLWAKQLGTEGLNAILQAQNTPIAIDGPDIIILPVMFDKRVNEHSYNLSVLRETYGDGVADPIPQRIAVAEAVAYGKTVWEYELYGLDPDVRKPYASLTERITFAALSTSVEAGNGK